MAEILVVVLAALSVGVIAYLAVIPYLSGEKKTAKRVQDVSKGRNSRSSRNSADELSARKKNVQDSLKELEKKQKSKGRLSIRTRLMRAGLEATPRDFYIASAITGIVLAGGVMIAGGDFPLAGLLGFVGALGLPRWVVGFLVKRRQAKFLHEFANAIDVIVRGVKTGLPLNECLEIIARESPEPVRKEFAELVEQQRIGIPLGDCFERMMERMPVPEVNFFSIVISIQQSAGGNLAEALGNLSGVLRSRTQLKAKVQALSSEAKASAAILGALPFIVMTMVYITSPDYISLLWKDQMGHLMLAGAGFWMFCGLYIMRKMINFKY